MGAMLPKRWLLRAKGFIPSGHWLAPRPVAACREIGRNGSLGIRRNAWQ
jgi:hypothetical protein